MPSDPLRWYDPSADNPPWIKALAEVRMLACREGWCYHHVQAVIVSILNKPHRIGGKRNDDVP